MSEAVFPVHISQALDRLNVPAVPDGFGDRLLARIAAGDLPDDTDAVAAALPPLRRPSGIGGWRRSGRILFVAATFGLATATAAAAGVFGDPVYIPVVSQALAQAKIVEMPTKTRVAVKVAEDEKSDTVAIQKAVMQEPTGKDAVLATLATLRTDPDFRNLPREQRQERVKAEIDKLIADGKLQKGDVKAAWAQLATQRKAANQARVEQGLPVPERRKIEGKSRAKPLTPEQKEKVREVVSQLTNDQRAELQLLRQRRREGTPQERRAVQSEIRAFWKRVGARPTAENAASETP